MLSSGRVLSLALDLGFDVAGVAPAFPVPGFDAYRRWLARGFHGEMGYLAREDRVLRRGNPDIILPGVRSVVCVGQNYYQGSVNGDVGQDTSRGRISRYAWGIDYHDVIQPRLEELAHRIVDDAQDGASYRCYVDTGPVLERAYAAQAGLGFIGKNTCLISPGLGSWLFLGEILTDAELTPTKGKRRGGCGTCRRCIDACPTGAIVEPYVVDARRCISYLTIELRDTMPEELRSLVGNRVFGCDICQSICPWQRFAQPTHEAAFHALHEDDIAPRLADLANLTTETFRERYTARPIARAGQEGLVRNAVVALANWGDSRAAKLLNRISGDVDPTVQALVEWAPSHPTRNREGVSAQPPD